MQLNRQSWYPDLGFFGGVVTSVVVFGAYYWSTHRENDVATKMGQLILQTFPDVAHQNVSNSNETNKLVCNIIKKMSDLDSMKLWFYNITSKTNRLWRQSHTDTESEALIRNITELYVSLIILFQKTINTALDHRNCTLHKDKCINYYEYFRDFITTGINEKNDAYRNSIVLNRHRNWLTCIAQLADNHLTSRSDKMIRIWPLDSSISPILQGPIEHIHCKMQLADGGFASGSWNKTLRMWKIGYL